MHFGAPCWGVRGPTLAVHPLRVHGATVNHHSHDVSDAAASLAIERDGRVVLLRAPDLASLFCAKSCSALFPVTRTLCPECDAAHAQLERIIESNMDIHVLDTRYRLARGEDVSAYEVERAFNAVADVGEWNRCHPEEPIT